MREHWFVPSEGAVYTNNLGADGMGGYDGDFTYQINTTGCFALAALLTAWGAAYAQGVSIPVGCSFDPGDLDFELKRIVADNSTLQITCEYPPLNGCSRFSYIEALRHILLSASPRTLSLVRLEIPPFSAKGDVVDILYVDADGRRFGNYDGTQFAEIETAAFVSTDTGIALAVSGSGNGEIYVKVDAALESLAIHDAFVGPPQIGAPGYTQSYQLPGSVQSGSVVFLPVSGVSGSDLRLDSDGDGIYDVDISPGDVVVPTSSVSWGEVKAIYR